MHRVLAVALIASCGKPADDTCTCRPANATKINAPGSSQPITSDLLLALLRRHVQYGTHNGRDMKLLDDQLRFAIASFCSPCGAWVPDRATIEQLYPLDRLDDASAATCLGLVLRDGTVAWGDARPRACHSM